MQKLQLRIVQERNIDIDGLRGDEFQVLKDYKKLEERKAMLNNVHDFFDRKYDKLADEGFGASRLGAESNPMPLSDHTADKSALASAESAQRRNGM